VILSFNNYCFAKGKSNKFNQNECKSGRRLSLFEVAPKNAVHRKVKVPVTCKYKLTFICLPQAFVTELQLFLCKLSVQQGLVFSGKMALT